MDQPNFTKNELTTTMQSDNGKVALCMLCDHGQLSARLPAMPTQPASTALRVCILGMLRHRDAYRLAADSCRLA